MSLYIFDSFNTLQHGDVKFLSHFAPKSKLKKIFGYKNEHIKKAELLAYLLLAYGLYHEYGLMMSNDTDMNFSEFGKPSLKCRADIHFNISHGETGVAVGIDRSEIGADIQTITSHPQSLMDFVCGSGEIHELALSGSRRFELFTKYWTLKESYLKCVGTGLTEELGKIDFSCIEGNTFKRHGYCFLCVPGSDYMAAFCSHEYLSPTAVKKVSSPDLDGFILCKFQAML